MNSCVECGARVGHYSKCPQRVPGVIMNNQPEPLSAEQYEMRGSWEKETRDRAERRYSTTCPDCGLGYWIDNGHTAAACITHLKTQLERLRNTPCFECGHS